jgi:ferredoxin hydrogenase
MKQKELESKFRCAKCGYITERQAPPKSCPICKAGADAFDDIGVDRSAEIKEIYNPRLI